MTFGRVAIIVVSAGAAMVVLALVLCIPNVEPEVVGGHDVNVYYEHRGADAADNDAAIADPVSRRLRAKIPELRHLETRSTATFVTITLIYPTAMPDLIALRNTLSDVRNQLPPATSLPVTTTYEILQEPNAEKPGGIVVGVKGADKAAREQRAFEVMVELRKIGGNWAQSDAVVRIDDAPVTELEGHDVSAVKIKEVVGAASDLSVRFH